LAESVPIVNLLGFLGYYRGFVPWSANGEYSKPNVKDEAENADIFIVIPDAFVHTHTQKAP